MIKIFRDFLENIEIQIINKNIFFEFNIYIYIRNILKILK